MKKYFHSDLPSARLNLGDSHTETYCLFHVYFDRKDPAFNPRLWLSTVKDSHPEILDYLAVDKKHYVYLIQNTFWVNQGQEVLEAILMTLNEDFEQSVITVIGSLVHRLENIKQQILFDKDTIEANWSHLIHDKVNRISHLLLLQIGKKIQASSIAQTTSYLQKLTNQDDRKLICYLFQNGGNISQTAQDLYLHRNTLNYRLNKINEITGLNLHLMSDLTLVYLLIC